MSTDGGLDRMSAVPLMNLTERRTNSANNPNSDDWSDQELEEFSRDPLESVLMQMRLWPQSITRQQCLRSAAYASAISLCIGFTAAYILFLLLYPPHYCMLANKFDQSLQDKLKHEINSSYIKQFLKNFTSEPILAGTVNDKEMAKNIFSSWIKHGLTQVRLVPYKSLLHFPSEQNQNTIQILHENGNVLGTLMSFDANVNSSFDSFVAFSPSGSVTGTVIYANYGQREDFERLKGKGLNINGTIALCRVKNNNIQQLINNAQAYGVSAVIVFPDPREFAPEGPTNVYPKKIWLPDSAVKSYSLDSHGDIFTPNFPSKDYAYRMGEDILRKLATIPIQPISYGDARELIKLLDGENALDNWQEVLNGSYIIKNNIRQVKLSVHDISSETEIFNVIGLIKGTVEPDRYVILGNHRDALGLGSVNAHGGTAVLLELSRTFGKLVKNGWHPRRTLVFCSWSGGAQGHIGSTEWAEEHAKILADRAVAYLNVDAVVQGKSFLEALSVPSLHGLIYDVTKLVTNPCTDEITAGRNNVYDTWIHKKSRLNKLLLPRIFNPKLTGDYCNFIHVLGIPVVELRYTNATSSEYQETFPLDATFDESFYLVETLMDSDFKYHTAMAQLYGLLALKLTDYPILPFNITNYANELKRIFNIMSNQVSIVEKLKTKQITLENLEASINNFINVSKKFQNMVKKIDMKDSVRIRNLNDKLMKVERAFIESRGLSCNPEFKHVIFSQDTQKINPDDSLPCLSDLLSEADKLNDIPPPMWEKIKQEIASLTFYILSAANVLEDEPL